MTFNYRTRYTCILFYRYPLARILTVMTSPRDQGRNNQPYYPELTSPTSTHRTQRSQPDYQGHTGNDPTWISTASQLNDTSQPPPAQPPLSTRRSATPFPVQAVLSDSQSSSTQSGSRSSGSGSATLYEPYVPPSEEICIFELLGEDSGRIFFLF